MMFPMYITTGIRMRKNKLRVRIIVKIRNNKNRRDINTIIKDLKFRVMGKVDFMPTLPFKF